MAVSKRLRYEVLRRDNHTCRYCGASAPDFKLTVDHVVPTTLGGSDEGSNLVAACVDCNAGKSSSSADSALIEDVTTKALEYATAQKWAAIHLSHDLHQLNEARRQFDDYWNTWHTTETRWNSETEKRERIQHPIPRPENWPDSIAQFIKAGLTIEIILDAARAALANDSVKAGNTFRYFCGICWSKARELADMTVEILEAKEAVEQSQRLHEMMKEVFPDVP